jgi:hypothetical protein
MNKKTAITILNRQIDKLKILESPKDYSYDWLVQTTTYIDNFFGLDSNQSKRIKDNPIGCSHTSNLIPFLNDCIETIMNIGLYKKPKINLLSSIPNWIIILILPALVTLGVLLGKYTSDIQNIELKREVKILNDSISSFRYDTNKNSDKITSQHDKNQ